MVRKTVTVVFADLVGSTALGERTDPEVLQELMAGYHTELRTILERHGGTVEKFVGDAVMAVFGIPQVHEDDALRAVRATEEMRTAVARLGLEVRIGVNTGEVVVGEGETLVTGDAVNVAARLEQAAAAGEILIGEATERLAREAIRVEPVEPLALKGKAEPVPAYRLLEVLPDAPAFTRAIDAPFVGRGHELETLARVLSSAIAERAPQLATIVGPPGIGKSRLARELMQGSRTRVLIGRCLSYGEGITYWPLAEIVAQVGDVRAALGDDDDAELAAARIAAALGHVDGIASSDEIAWGFRKLFEVIARTEPLIVVLDDIHWAEPTLLDLIEYVAAFAQDAPFLLLCMARPDVFERRPSWANQRHNATLVTLEPLDASDAEALVERLHGMTENAKRRIVEAAEGNPLFVEQLVAMQTESGNGELEIPPTIQALLSARIDGLEPEERSVIERASIEGRLFHRGSVAELLPVQARADVGGHLMTLVRKEFVRPDRATLPGDDGFRFGHNLIRDAAYDSLPKRLRAELHERFADWLESKLGNGTFEEILGYHLEQAYRYRVELGAEDDHARDLALRAGRLFAHAGRRAEERGDAAATCALVARATELLPESDSDQPPLLVILGVSTFDTGDAPRAVEILQDAQRAAAAAGQRSVELRARMRELGVLIARDPELSIAATQKEAEAAIAELSESDDAESLASTWWVVALAANMRGDFVLKERAASHRLDLALRTGLRRHAAGAAWMVIAALAQGPTPVGEAIPRAEQVLADFPEERPGEDSLGLLYAFAGRDAEAQQAIARSRSAQLELGQQMQYAADSMDLGWIALVGGQPARAEHELRKGAEFLDAAGETGWLSTVAAVLAEVLYRLGRDDEADEWSRRSEQTTSPYDVVSQALWRSTRAKVMARRGEAAGAVRLSAEAVDQARLGDYPHLLGDCLFDRGEVLRLLGRVGEARSVLEEALAVYERKGIVPSVERTRVALAELA